MLQGDHGSAVHGFFKSPSNESVSATNAWERFGAFGAYYLPDGGAAAFGDSVSVVNVLGNVLRHYFRADLPREPDDRYLAVEAQPFRFRPRGSRVGRPRGHHPAPELPESEADPVIGVTH